MVLRSSVTFLPTTFIIFLCFTAEELEVTGTQQGIDFRTTAKVFYHSQQFRHAWCTVHRSTFTPDTCGSDISATCLFLVLPCAKQRDGEVGLEAECSIFLKMLQNQAKVMSTSYWGSDKHEVVEAVDWLNAQLWKP